MIRPSLRRAFLRAAALAPVLLGAACVTEETVRPPGPLELPPEAPAGAAPPAAQPAAGESPEERERSLEFGRTLQSVDKRVDQFVWLGTQPGEDARDRRETERTALEAVVAQHSARFLAAASAKEESTRRRIAVKALAFSTAPEATGPLVAALGDTGDAQIRTNAGFALARRRDPVTPIPPLLDASRADDAYVRVNALLALWHVLDARAEKGTAVDAATRDQTVAALETAMFDPDEPLARGHAAAAMGALGDPRGVDPLLNLLRDRHPAVRTHTALALGKLGDRRAIRPLVAVIDDTPKGTPRGAVCLGISLLLEREGIAVPADMPEETRVWSGFVQRVLPTRPR